MEINIINKSKIEITLNDLKTGDIFFFISDGMNHPYILIDNTYECCKIFDLEGKQVDIIPGDSKVRLYNKAELNLEV